MNLKKQVYANRKIKLLLKCIVLAAAAIVLGCANRGNLANTTQNTAGQSAQSLAVATGAASTISPSGGISNSTWNCPSSPNVLLKDNIVVGGFDYSGEEDFTVCVNRDNPAEFQISGTTSATALCVYPMYSSYGSPTKLAEPAQCFSVGSAPIDVTFKSTTINYMVIVNADYTNAFNACLSSTTSCPPYSEGFVQ